MIKTSEYVARQVSKWMDKRKSCSSHSRKDTFLGSRNSMQNP